MRKPAVSAAAPRGRARLHAQASAWVLAVLMIAAAGQCSPTYAQAVATAEPDPGPASAAELRQIKDELQALRAEEANAKAAEQDRVRRIDALAHRLGAATGEPVPLAAPAAAPDIETIPVEEAKAAPPTKWGGFEPGKGIVLMRSDTGEMDVGLVSYLRYLNQHGMDKTYTSAFGQPFDVTPREDFQLAKVQIVFKGWLFDPRFGYNAYVWTSQTSQGLGAQVVAAGNLNYRFADWLKVYFGIQSVPSTRSTNRTFPYWLRNDNRPIADEYFRGSYTQGIWADGTIMKGLDYRVMIANNLSALGVNARQLDANPNTFSGALTWKPTTGEFGPIDGYGDFEEHQKVATLLGVHYTSSTEDPQSQPATDSIENTQLRLSDGTLLFSDTAFGTGRITQARYQMVALDAAVKYKGFSLEGEFYQRWLNDFTVIGTIPFDSLYDNGFELQASAMIIPKTLQVYFSGSMIFGKYGDPYDAAVGINYFPFKRRDVRVNVMGLYVKNSPVGYTAYPVPVGGNGFTFVSDFSLAF